MQADLKMAAAAHLALGAVHAALWFFRDDQIAHWIALVVWTGVTAMLSIPARRRLFGTPRYVDDLLFAAWLLTLNRMCFSVQALVRNDAFADVTRWSGIAAALFYAYVVSSYIWPKRTPGLKRA